MEDLPAATRTAEHSTALAREALAILAGGDDKHATALVHPDYVDHASTRLRSGMPAFLAQRRALHEAFADVELAPLAVIAGDAHVVARVLFRGLHVADYAGLAPSNRTIETDEIHIWHIKDNRLIEHWVCRDDLKALRQMRATSERH
jgi:predicted ester cyclase